MTLPRRKNPHILGESRTVALTPFSQNERSLTRKGKLADFKQVLLEYLELEHAEVVPPADLQKLNGSQALPRPN